MRAWYEEGPADEIFLGSEPLLLGVGPLSLLISGLRLAEGRGAEDWKPVFAGHHDLVRCSADEGRGLLKARKDAGVALPGDSSSSGLAVFERPR